MKGRYFMAEIRNVRKDIGQRIQEARKAKGLSQDELANKLGSKRTTIGNYERGERSIDTDMVKKIADALGVPSSLLIDGIPDGYKDRYSIKELVNGDSNFYAEYVHDITSEDAAERFYAIESNINEIKTFALDLRDMNYETQLNELKSYTDTLKDEITLKCRTEKINDLIENSTTISKKKLNEINNYDPFKELANRREEDKKLNYHYYFKGGADGQLFELIESLKNNNDDATNYLIPKLQKILDEVEYKIKNTRV